MNKLQFLWQNLLVLSFQYLVLLLMHDGVTTSVSTNIIMNV